MAEVLRVSPAWPRQLEQSGQLKPPGLSGSVNPGKCFLNGSLPEQSTLDHGCQETCLCETFVRAPRTLAISTAEACSRIQTVEGLCCWQGQVPVLIARAFADDVMSPAQRFNNEACSLKVRLSQQEKGGRENQPLTGKGRGYPWKRHCPETAG